LKRAAARSHRLLSHERGWANRLVSGDSLLVMNSLLQKESMAARCR